MYSTDKTFVHAWWCIFGLAFFLAIYILLGNMLNKIQLFLM